MNTCRYQVTPPQDALYLRAIPRARSVKSLKRAMEVAALFYHDQSPFLMRPRVAVRVVAHHCPEDFRQVGWFDDSGWHWHPTGRQSDERTSLEARSQSKAQP